MPQSHFLVFEFLPPLLHPVLNLFIYQPWVIQQLPSHCLFEHSGFNCKSLKNYLLHTFVIICENS